VVRIRGTEHKTIGVAKINQAGIALSVFDDQGNDTLQDLLEAHLANHEAANLLKQTELLLDPLQAALDIFCLRHGFIIV
jgi:hypothetical protein